MGSFRVAQRLKLMYLKGKYLGMMISDTVKYLNHFKWHHLTGSTTSHGSMGKRRHITFSITKQVLC